jgi:hypothetical protein
MARDQAEHASQSLAKDSRVVVQALGPSLTGAPALGDAQREGVHTPL